MPHRLRYLRASGLPQGVKPRGQFAHFFHFPSPVDWLPVDRAISERWNIMLCWDAKRAEWRCDLIKPGQIISGRGELVGEAVADAWRRVVDLVERVVRPASR